ncbi:MAG TPA: hypothetical protein VFA04_03080 [Bryobacteraceae bacterium]|nr:hypothetical protein [Bryobacteraceae bacterium]
MPQQSSGSSFFEGLLKDFVYTFVYLPTTNWQHFFSPTVYFGCNVDEMGVEEHVLSRAGSYGSQINRIIDVLSILTSRLDEGSLTAEQQVFLQRFRSLAASADQASAEFQGKARHTVSEADVDDLVSRISALKATDLSGHKMLIERVRRALPAA